MICKKCGAQIPDNSAECSFCGAEYEVAPVEEAVPEAEAEEQVNETLGVDDSQDEIDRMLDDNERNRQRQSERINSEKQKQLDEIAKRRAVKKRRQRRNKLLIALAVVAAAGAVAAGVNHVRQHKDDVPEVVIVSHEPTAEAPEVVTSPEAEGDENSEEAEAGAETTADNAEANSGGSTVTGTAASGDAASGGTSWRSTGGGGSTGSAAAGLAPASGTSGGSASAGSSAGAASAGSRSSGSAPVSSSGYNGSSFKSALVTGGEVKNSGGNNYMSFSYNGKTYYAKVSADTTTAAVSGKPMTISASKTGETYNGSEVYEITSITNYDGKYVFAESGYKLLTAADLAGKTAWELKVGRNEIYARHGRTFKDKELQAYFNSCSWYKADPNYNKADDSANLNPTELKNAYFILDYERTHQ